METQELSQVAMLHRLRVSQWGASQKDKEASDKVCAENNASDGAADVIVRLVPKEELKPIQREANKVKAIRQRYTLPWIDDGVRILPARFYERCTTELTAAIADFDAAVNTFVSERYPCIVQNEAKTLGQLLANNPLPSQDQIRSKFSISQTITPLPKASDFQVRGITNGPLEEIRANITRSITDATGAAVQSLYGELAKMVQRIKDTTALKDKVFRDSLIGNLKDFCEVLPTLNITGDAKLNQLCRECAEQLANIKPQDLRDDTYLRQQTAVKAEGLLRKINFDID